MKDLRDEEKYEILPIKTREIPWAGRSSRPTSTSFHNDTVFTTPLYHKPLSRVQPARDTSGRPVRILQRSYASQKESDAVFTRHVVACFVIKHKPELNCLG